MSRPPTTTRPEVAVSMPPRMFSAVVLPAPDCPRITVSSPRSAVKLASSSARIVVRPDGYSLTTRSNSIYAIMHLPAHVTDVILK